MITKKIKIENSISNYVSRDPFMDQGIIILTSYSQLNKKSNQHLFHLFNEKLISLIDDLNSVYSYCILPESNIAFCDIDNNISIYNNIYSDCNKKQVIATHISNFQPLRILFSNNIIYAISSAGNILKYSSEGTLIENQFIDSNFKDTIEFNYRSEAYTFCNGDFVCYDSNFKKILENKLNPPQDYKFTFYNCITIDNYDNPLLFANSSKGESEYKKNIIKFSPDLTIKQESGYSNETINNIRFCKSICCDSFNNIYLNSNNCINIYSNLF